MSKPIKPFISAPVQYVSPKGGCRAALIIGIVDGSTVNLAVFSDGAGYGAGPVQELAVPYSEDAAAHTWWPERT